MDATIGMVLGSGVGIVLGSIFCKFASMARVLLRGVTSPGTSTSSDEERSVRSKTLALLDGNDRCELHSGAGVACVVSKVGSVRVSCSPSDSAGEGSGPDERGRTCGDTRGEAKSDPFAGIICAEELTSNSG